MKIAVIGTGYVGLVTGTCFAEVGNDVLCVDLDYEKIAGLKEGKVPIYEPGLDSLVKNNITSGRLQFTTDISDAIGDEKNSVASDVLFIAVGTPPDEDGSADLSYVTAVAREVGKRLNGYLLVVTKSTVPVGTAEKVRDAIQEELDKRGVSIEFGVASNPEFLKEGAAIEDFMKPDRVVVGVDDDKAVELMRTLYTPFNRNHERLIVMDIPSAELTKYAANAMLATKISFMNELSNLAEKLNADIELVRQGIGSDPRIGYHFIYPGCGYGGSCFPKDVQALYRTAEEQQYDARILAAVEAVNKDQKEVILNKIDVHYQDVSGKCFAIWGLAFKPNTDDMREAPSRVIIEGLWDRGASVVAYDPVASDEANRIYAGRDDFSTIDDYYAVLDGVDGLIIATEWKNFRSPDLDRMKGVMKSPVLFDGRNIFDPIQLREAGFIYYGIGR